MTTIGIAMLARNSYLDMSRAIAPFTKGNVDEIAIVLGGPSTDDTPAYAYSLTSKVADYSGPLAEDGGLLDFAHARQQSFDLLTTDWALVIDTDDVWSGVDKLGEVVSDAEAGDHQGVRFPHYSSSSAVFQQSRLYRRTSGYWTSPVHEFWAYYSEPEVKVHLTNLMAVRQEKDLAGRMASTWRNIRIAEAHLQDHLDPSINSGQRFRLLMHLSREYMITAQYDKVLATVQKILDNLHLGKPEDTHPDKMFQIHYMRGMAHICLEQYEQAAGAATKALGFARYGHGWTMLAEVAYQMGAYDLTLCAADKALQAGRPITDIPAAYANVSSVPYHLKAKALVALGRKHEALAALDLGLGLGGGEDMGQFKYELCEELGVIP